MLNGESVINDCTFAGVSRIIVPLTGFSTCNAAYTAATINGVTQNAFVTSESCTKAMDAALNAPGASLYFDLQIGDLRYPIDKRVVDIAPGPNGLGYLTINSTYAAIFNNLGCQAPACPYNASDPAMAGNIDYNDCQVVSYGASDATTLSQSGLKSVALRLNPFGCQAAAAEPFSGYAGCFESKNGDPIYCSGDSGAPVYCKAKSNGEDLLVGITGYANTCGDNNEIAVIGYNP